MRHLFARHAARLKRAGLATAVLAATALGAAVLPGAAHAADTRCATSPPRRGSTSATPSRAAS